MFTASSKRIPPPAQPKADLVNDSDDADGIPDQWPGMLLALCAKLPVHTAGPAVALFSHQCSTSQLPYATVEPQQAGLGCVPFAGPCAS